MTSNSGTVTGGREKKDPETAAGCKCRYFACQTLRVFQLFVTQARSVKRSRPVRSGGVKRCGEASAPWVYVKDGKRKNYSFNGSKAKPRGRISSLVVIEVRGAFIQA